LDEFGLINMNGRVYDPSVGRFLSPDNEVQAPDNSQSYNRYAYCMNNPLKYTDPTGYLWYKDNFGNWTYWAEPGFLSDEDVDPSKLKDGDYTLTQTDRVLVCGFWNNGRFNLTDPFFQFPLYAATLTDEGRKHKKEAEEEAKQAAKDKTKTKTVVEKRKEDIAKLKAKNGGGVSSYTKRVLSDIMNASGNSSYRITSTTRSPEDQARIMYDNISKYGKNAQKKLYGSLGDQVIDMYPDKSLMLSKIIEVGPSGVSKHCGDPSLINVIDISPGSIQNRSSFEEAVRTNSAVSRYYMPPTDPAYHLEIPQP
jgi:RHS repeat-associated protein